MLEFDNDVQLLKYKVLREIAKSAFEGTLLEDFFEIPKKIAPGPKPTLRCCIYKERAIVEDRIKMALGGHKSNPNIVEVIRKACDECPLGGYEVTFNCRGCLSHKCQKACRRGAITIDPVTRKSTIDKSKCVNCGLCAKACPYHAIQNYVRPCEQACKVKAISAGEDQAATIDNTKCISCGSCVSACPFGAIVEKSSMVDVINVIKDSNDSAKYPVYAIVAPSFAAQVQKETVKQLINGIKMLGFSKVIEAAVGADMVATTESQELVEKGFLTSSCCPAFVQFVRKNFPKVAEHISHNPSPMVALGKYLKEKEPECKVVFIGPCIAKKAEAKLPENKEYVDYVLTFEELQAMFHAKDIRVTDIEETEVDDASYFGRIFARSGGVSEAVVQSLKEQGIEFDVKPLLADGLDNCRMGLIKASSPSRDFNFLEGMACTSGCIGGPSNLTHEIRDKSEIDAFGRTASKKSIKETIDTL